MIWRKPLYKTHVVETGAGATSVGMRRTLAIRGHMAEVKLKFSCAGVTEEWPPGIRGALPAHLRMYPW